MLTALEIMLTEQPQIGVLDNHTCNLLKLVALQNRLNLSIPMDFKKAVWRLKLGIVHN